MQPAPPALTAPQGGKGANASDAPSCDAAAEQRARREPRSPAQNDNRRCGAEAGARQSHTEVRVSPSAGADAAVSNVLSRGAEVQYRNRDDALEPARIVDVHYDDATPYYTILLHNSGAEKQTIRSRLEP